MLFRSPKAPLKILSAEGGGHRYQRVPPTDKRGRTQTSTVTVAVLPIVSEHTVTLNPRDLEVKTCRGSGKGGQKRNVTDCAVQVTHLPSGVSARVESDRSQHVNKALAIEAIRSRLAKAREDEQNARVSAKRRSQVGSGMRGDKAFTIAIQRDQAVRHATGARTSAKRYMRGHLEDLN